MTLSDFFKRYTDWLHERPRVNLVLVFSYFVFIFFMHKPVANLSVWVMNLLQLPVYNKVVIGISAFLLLVYLVLVAVQLIKNAENRVLKVTYLFLVLALIILHFRYMFEMNIEIIHIFQYSILAFLIFPLTRRFGATVIFAVPFMLLDEWNQYINLYPGFVQYFEFNDVILDINGCGLAVITLLIYGVQVARNLQPVWKRPEFIGVLVFVLLFVIAIKTCFFSLYAVDKCANTFLVLNIVPEAPVFWSKFPGRDVIYHIMQPVEATVAIVLLSFFYLGLDSFRK